MADFLSLLTAIPALIHDFSGAESDPYQKQREQLAQQQQQYAQAASNPNNPLYKNLYGQYQDQNKLNLAQVIAEAQGQNRLNSRMGRTPLFSNERGGENLFRSLMQGYQGVGAQSDQQTRQALLGSAGINNSAQAAYSSMTPNAAKANAQQLSGFQGIANLLSPQQQRPVSVGSLGGGNYTAPAAPQGYQYNDPNNNFSSFFRGIF